MPFSHVSISVTNIEASKAFYTTLLAPLGYKVLMDFGVAVGFGTTDKPDFLIGKVPNGKKLSDETPLAHVAFAAASKEVVQAFHDAGLKAGGKDNGAPGERPHYGPGYYGSFVLDPDGYNVEAHLWT